MDILPGFDPDFDDCTLSDGWLSFPLIQVRPGEYEGFRIRAWEIDEAELCDQRIRLDPPLSIRGLVTADGTLWMSDVPQERLMMWNNAQVSRGDVLVGGMGLGLYPQYVLAHCKSLCIVDRAPAILALLAPLLEVAAAPRAVPLALVESEISAYLRSARAGEFDAVFLDTWATLSAALLPEINALRDAALRLIRPGGRVLLWGYGTILRLYLKACRSLLEVSAWDRESFLALRAESGARRVLDPVLARFAGQDDIDMEQALAWCYGFAIRLRAGETP